MVQGLGVDMQLLQEYCTSKKSVSTCHLHLSSLIYLYLDSRTPNARLAQSVERETLMSASFRSISRLRVRPPHRANGKLPFCPWRRGVCLRARLFLEQLCTEMI